MNVESFSNPQRINGGQDISHWSVNLAIAIGNEANSILGRAGRLAVLLGQTNLNFNYDFFEIDENRFIMTLKYFEGLVCITGGVSQNSPISTKTIERIQRGEREFGFLHEETEQLQGAFVLCARRVGDTIDWDEIRRAIFDWLKEVKIKEITNEISLASRMFRKESTFAHAASNAVIVLECETSCFQGTAFSLDGVGFVSCSHVLGPSSVAFSAKDPTKRFKVEVVNNNKELDVCILRAPGLKVPHFVKSKGGTVDYFDTLYLAGHPNYRLGDSLVISEGACVGFRNVSSFRRILTDGNIVTGMSGGPALNVNGEVVGICANGKNYLGEQDKTEDVSIIPIEVVDSL